MNHDMMIAESLRRWRDDNAPAGLRTYAMREWGASACFLCAHRANGAKPGAHLAGGIIFTRLGALLASLLRS
jgi:acyl-CoA thioesterase